MNFTSFASSSAGNCYTLDDEETKILVECGVTAKDLKQFLNFKVSEYAGCLVSHEHKDHSKCVDYLLKNGMNVYMSEGTAAAINATNSKILTADKVQQIGTFDILPFATFHDAKEPLGFLIRSRKDNERILFATDTVNLGFKADDLDYLAIEANYKDEYLQKSTRLPEKIRYRITNSHFEIDMLCNYLKKCDLSKCKEVFLLHLSDSFARENEFREKVQDICKRAKVTVCKK